MTKPSPLQPFLTQQGYLLLDGGLATELEQRGFDLNTPLWSAQILQSQPEAIKAVHRAYLEAGADCLITASYQASFLGFQSQGFSAAETKMLLQRSVDLAGEARSDYLAQADAERADRLPPLIAASIGPYGAYLADGSEYRGNYGISNAQLRDFHQARWEILAASGADLLACETIPSQQEAEVLLALLEETPDVYAWLSFSCRDEQHIGEGTPLRDCARLLAEHERVVAIGINCTAPQHIPALIQEVAAAAPAKPIIVYPNSGEEYHSHDKSWSGDRDAVIFSEAAKSWHAAGATVIGGCCRTGPGHIQSICTVLKKNF